jgi:hypothetical protein
MRQKKVNLIEIHRLGHTLGLGRTDIDVLLCRGTPREESLILSLGPPRYGGGFYGVVSIYDFTGTG